MKLRSLLIVSSILLLVACSSPSLCTDLPRPELSQASAEAESGILAKIAADIRLQHGNDASGFRLLDGSEEALEWRLALIDSAVSSLDIQTYLWYPDDSGTLLLERVVEAANRGVRVRLIVDDLLTIGLGQLMYELQNHPNIEFRIFNPWKERGVLSRAGAFLVEMERLNRRMHDKLMVADGVAAIVGGRNIGDHYFGLSDAYNFHDLDLLGFGAIGAQASGMFDSFWNQVCLRPRDRFWDIPVPKIDSAFDNLLVPQPSWSPSTTQQL
ncbi:phospholipase D-like domain-containing protein, partial [Thiolapillus sp.]